MPSSEPVATLKTATQPDLAPLAALSASASSSLDRIEAQLGSLEAVGTPLTDGNLGEGAAALALVAESAAELQAAYAFIDQLAESVAAAGLLVEATERRLEVLERGEKLPESIASLPPPMFTNHQFTRQIRRRERAAPPDLPELTLLPPSQAASALANAANTSCSGAGAGGAGSSSSPASASAPVRESLAAAAARDREELARDMAELQIQVSAAAAKASAQVSAAADTASARVSAAADTARAAADTARSLLNSSSLSDALNSSTLSSGLKSWWSGGGKT